MPAPWEPAPFFVSYTLTTCNLYEVDIVLGQASVVVGEPTSSAFFPIHPRLEWKSMLGMSPATAKKLHLQLGEVLAQYQERWGAIPDDCNDRGVGPQGENVTFLHGRPQAGPQAEVRAATGEPPAVPEPPSPAA